MIARGVKVQLLVFALVTLVTLWYGATSLLDLGKVVNPPYTVKAVFASPGGIYPRADVDLLGTRVGEVDSVEAGPGAATTVVMSIDPDVKLPADISAVLGSKSAIGEGFIQLKPKSSGGALLKDGSVIPLSATTSPPELATLLGHLGALADSVPLKDLEIGLREGAAALTDIGPVFGRLIRDSSDLSEASLANIESLTALIRDSKTVLDTQVDLAPETQIFLRELAGLTTQLRKLDPTFAKVYANGIAAGTEVTDLLRANQDALPVLLNNLISVTNVAADRIPGLRKALVVFPWVLQNGITTARYCDEYDINTGKPNPKTCHYDDNGVPIYTLHLAQQFPQSPTGPPYFPCTKGYEGTKRYLPSGEPADGVGPNEGDDQEPNLRAHCAASPSDPNTPNVRGAQNITRPAYEREQGRMAIYNPRSGVLAAPGVGAYRLRQGEFPPQGEAEGLAWLLVQPMMGG